MRPKGKKWFF